MAQTLSPQEEAEARALYEEFWRSVSFSCSVAGSRHAISLVLTKPEITSHSNKKGIEMPGPFADYPPPIDGPAQIRRYRVYQYAHLDELRFMPDAETVLATVTNRDAILDAVRDVLQRAGWEGDGTIQMMWLPPFVGAGVEDTHGVFIWHVKQSNNGTSWLASPVDLPFESIREQNL
jgi:hypothetical protein